MEQRDNQAENYMKHTSNTQQRERAEQALLEFFQSTYEAGATLGQWDKEKNSGQKTI